MNVEWIGCEAIVVMKTDLGLCWRDAEGDTDIAPAAWDRHRHGVVRLARGRGHPRRRRLRSMWEMATKRGRRSLRCSPPLDLARFPRESCSRHDVCRSPSDGPALTRSTPQSISNFKVRRSSTIEHADQSISCTSSVCPPSLGGTPISTSMKVPFSP